MLFGGPVITSEREGDLGRSVLQGQIDDVSDSGGARCVDEGAAVIDAITRFGRPDHEHHIDVPQRVADGFTIRVIRSRDNSPGPVTPVTAVVGTVG